MLLFIKNNLKLLKQSAKNIIIFELIYKLLFVILILPISTLLIKLTIKLSGYRYLTNENYFSYIKNPLTILIFLFLLFLGLTYLIGEYYCICTLLQLKRTKKKIKLIDFIKLNINLIINTFRLKNIPFLFFGIIYGLITNVMIWFSLSSATKIPDDIIRYINKNQILLLFIIFTVIILYIVGVRFLFLIHFYALNGLEFKLSIKYTNKLIKNKFNKILGLYFIFNLAILLSVILIYVLMILLIISIINILKIDNNIQMAIFLAIFKYVNYIILIIGSIFSISLNFCFITNLYNRYLFKNYLPNINKNADKTYQSSKLIIVIPIIIVAILSSLTSYFMLSDANIKYWIGLKSPLITSHRGSSYYAPENTMLAIEYAVRDLSNYVEIDVQQTKDGEIIVMHDLNLLRTTGVNKKVSEVTYDEIKNLDAGKWFDKNLQDAKIPTLDEVLEYCKGKIKLNIEIKGYQDAVNIEQKVAQAIDKYDMVEDCYVSSFNYNSLKKIKQYNDKIKTGYIISIAYGNFSKMKYADFFSIRATAVNKNMIDEIHSVSKQVHVWTVNSESQMRMLTQMGVDNIITDNPILANEVINSKNSSTTFIELLDLIFE